VAEGSDLARIDSQTSLFFCLYGGYNELEFNQGIPINLLYETHPQFVHSNGGWPADAMMGRRQRSLNR